MSQKQVLVWDQDDRSIGIMDDEDRYVPVIRYNFTVVGNINEQHHPYRGWVCLVKTQMGRISRSSSALMKLRHSKVFIVVLLIKLGVLTYPIYHLMRLFGQNCLSGSNMNANPCLTKNLQLIGGFRFRPKFLKI